MEATHKLQKSFSTKKMKNTTQATKSKALGPIPNFSIGLTPSDEEKSDDNKANMRDEHLNYCRGCTEVYSTAAKTLQRRIGEANASTSGKFEPTPIDKAHKSEGEETDTSSTEKSPKNLPHLNDADSEETSTTNEAEQDDNKSSGAEKGVEVPEIQENKNSGTEKVVEVADTKEKQSSSSCEEEKISKTGDMSSFNVGQAQGEPSNPNPSTQAENRFNRDDDTKSNDENDNVEEVEIDAKKINEEACNVGI
ncbi:hypothetical protein P8452_40375 [Trifolium repens]|nr:hypothetical protein P8452_40375 [Trifolium repens]